jgi:hypothetical protein
MTPAPQPRLLLLALMGGVLLTSACAARGEPTPPRPDPEARTLEGRAFTEDGRRDVFARQGLRMGARTGVEVRTQLGVPAEVVARAVQNQHDPAVTDSIFLWRYDGLDVEIYRTADGRRLLSRATVRDNRHLRFPEVGIGVREEAVRRLLGEPERSGPEGLEYRCGRCEGPPEPFVFRVEDGRVQQVDFVFYVD